MKYFKIFISEIKIRPLFGGLLSNIPFLYSIWDNSRPTGRAFSGKYVKSIWKYHFDNYKKFKKKYEGVPLTVAEFGTGASLGTLISAIKDGVKKVIGLDLIPYANNYKLNKKIIDELIPYEEEPILNKSLCNEVENLSNQSLNRRIKYLAPYDEKKLPFTGSIDFIFSHSVLEHVDDIKSAYGGMFELLKKGGIMSHKIDHSSHAITRSWNGHYALNKFFWKIIRGNKPYLLNRLTPSDHKRIILQSGFRIIHEEYVRSNLSEKNCLIFNDEDHLIKTSLFILQK